ncbi:hypothetical protein GN956_G2395 [Arapaima gigas]
MICLTSWTSTLMWKCDAPTTRHRHVTLCWSPFVNTDFRSGAQHETPYKSLDDLRERNKLGRQEHEQKEGETGVLHRRHDERFVQMLVGKESLRQGPDCAPVRYFYPGREKQCCLQAPCTL